MFDEFDEPVVVVYTCEIKHFYCSTLNFNPISKECRSFTLSLFGRAAAIILKYYGNYYGNQDEIFYCWTQIGLPQIT